MSTMLAEYKVGKAVYQIRPDGFVDNINPRLPNMEIVYPWNRIYAALEYEREKNPRTGMVENVIRWMRVYHKNEARMIAQIPITDNLRESMYQFFRVFQNTQANSVEAESKSSNVRPLRP